MHFTDFMKLVMEVMPLKSVLELFFFKFLQWRYENSKRTRTKQTFII